MNQLLKKHKDLLCELVKEAVSLKVDIILKDPRESGLRKVLNFGHSIGHALEVRAGYQHLSHGEAVALGMLIETKIAHNRGICSQGFEKQITQILSFLRNQEIKPKGKLNVSNSLSSLSFPQKRESIFKYIKNIDYNQFWETLTLDKKNYQGRITFILPEALGKVGLIDNINKEEIIKALEELKKE